jgi:calcium/calmodulin-dependent protein kinase (CaM kinase) II
LDSISTNDWITYETLCDTSLTCFEEEANGNLVQGLEFHKFYFDITKPKGEFKNKSTMHDSIVRVMGKSALITYIRERKDIASGTIERFKETRIWELIDGSWKHVHFHRNKL